MTLRAVIFDFGGVLVRTADHSRRTAWEQRLGLSPGQAEQIVFGGESEWAVQLGRISDADHWRWVQARLGLEDESLSRFRHDFFAGDELDLRLMAYIGRLRSLCHLGLLSNASDRARRMFTEQYNLLQVFDSITISAEEGIMKPDPRIYRLALARAEVQPDETLFVDDARRNIDAALALGMHTVHFLEPQQALQQIAALTGIPAGDDEIPAP